MEDNVVSSEAPLTIVLFRLGKDKPLVDTRTRAAHSIDKSMPVQMKHIKISPSAIAVKTGLNAPNTYNNKQNPSPAFTKKWRVLVVRDLSVHRHDDHRGKELL